MVPPAGFGRRHRVARSRGDRRATTRDHEGPRAGHRRQRLHRRAPRARAARRPAGRSGRWPGRRPGCATRRGRPTSRSPSPTSPTPTACARRSTTSTSPTTSCTRSARKPEFEDEDRLAATTFAEQAEAAGVRRIVYLGGLTPEGEELSPHLRSREEVGAHPARQRRADDRAAGRGRDRQRQRQLRDAAPPDRAAAGDGRAEVGRHAHPADRHPRRAALPRRQRRHAGRRQPGVRHRRPRRPHVRRHDAALRRRRPGCRAAGCSRCRCCRRRCRATGSGSITPVPGSLARPLVESLRNTVVCREHDIATLRAGPARTG